MKFVEWKSAFSSFYVHEITAVIYFVYLHEKIIPKTIILNLKDKSAGYKEFVHFKN